MTEYQYNKGKILQQDVYTYKDMFKLVAVCSRRAPTGIRNSALICWMWFAGLRPGELLSITWSDLDLDKARCSYIRNKSRQGERGSFEIHQMMAMLLRKWAKVCKNKEGPLFCTLQGRPLSQTYVRQMLPKKAVLAGITKRIHPMGFRRSTAMRLQANGIPWKDLMEKLGHKTDKGPIPYIDHDDPTFFEETVTYME